MAKRVFYSFHYTQDAWRAAQVRSMGIVESDRPATDNEWESVKKGGDQAISKWIDGQLFGKSCAIVLIGEYTAGRKWINYEIKEAWNAGKGLVGVYINKLKDASGKQSRAGSNPFASFTFGSARQQLSSVVKTYDPPYLGSTDVYSYINRNLEDWIDEAIEIRKRY